jgi:hypothetical protein
MDDGSEVHTCREIARSASTLGKLWMYEREGEGKALKEISWV